MLYFNQDNVFVLGGWTTFFMAMTSYITCVTSEAERTSRMSIGLGIFTTSIFISQFASGVIADNTSFHFVFCLSLSLNCLAIIYISFRIKHIQNITSNYPDNSEESTKYDRKQNPKAIIKRLLRKRHNNGRCHLAIMLIVMFFMLFGNYRKSKCLVI